MYNDVRWLSRCQVLNGYVELLDGTPYFLSKKEKEYPELTDITWLSASHFFADFTLHFNNWNTKLLRCGNVAQSVFGHIRVLEKK